MSGGQGLYDLKGQWCFQEMPSFRRFSGVLLSLQKGFLPFSHQDETDNVRIDLLSELYDMGKNLGKFLHP